MISSVPVTLIGLLLLLGRALVPAATPVATPPPTTVLTNTFITCTNGTIWTPTNAIFRGAVRVFDAQLYLECEHLDVFYPSNSAPTSPSPSATSRDDTTPNIGSITAIVAHTNVLLMLHGSTIIGDRAYYWATNDMMQVMGEIVVIETDKGYFYGTNFIFNRRTMEMQSIGPSTLESKPGVNLLEGTNAPPGAPKPKPRAPTGSSPAPGRSNP